ncbi:nucleotidyl transferase AbiEii/AbiGii toxin family protein [Dinghuibacter silviterrae]|uniref:nucleotidyl transferase AbiEii/AbiGii toxin family protein n=1 Tax=Dinghuibacter silviterrae TaxID=1539049 RepID=UPI0013C34D2C|nr:nucleotidyl transferase AbiEii/AbiGii toxin family protein [Dinghuibacter silviterrae]
MIKRLSEDQQLSEFYLVGGASLALQIGHRKSFDIDLFCAHSFDSDKMAKHLENDYQAESLESEKNVVHCFIGEVKLDILSHQYPWLNPPTVEEQIRLASLDDIAAMKLSAIVTNGTRYKDFVDIFALLEHRTLDQMTTAYEQKYQMLNAAIVKMCLLNHRDVKLVHKIDLLHRPVHRWYHIADRLDDAVINPRKIYPPHLDWNTLDDSRVQDIWEEESFRYQTRRSKDEDNSKGWGYGYGYGW